MTSNNDRCPFNTECNKKCVYQMKEIECPYYNANAMPGMELEDQEAKRFREEEEFGGIDSFEDVDETQIGSLVMLPVDRLHPHPDNPRKALGDLTELAESIKANGIFQNLTVVPDDPTSSYTTFTVIIGHRRLAAAKLAGLTSVPCVITEMSPDEQVATMLAENMQRNDLSVYEQAIGGAGYVYDWFVRYWMPLPKPPKEGVNEQM